MSDELSRLKTLRRNAAAVAMALFLLLAFAVGFESAVQIPDWIGMALFGLLLAALVAVLVLNAKVRAVIKLAPLRKAPPNPCPCFAPL